MTKVKEYFYVIKWLLRHKHLINWIRKSNNDVNLWEVWGGDNSEYYAIGFFKDSPTGILYKNRYFDVLHDKKETREILKEMKSYSYRFKHED